MNINSPEFVPSARRDTTIENRFERSKLINGKRSIIAINQHQLHQQQQQTHSLQLPHFMLGQIYVWTPTVWRVRQRYDYDTVQQRFGSNGSHQQDQEIPGKDESGSVICNQFAINHSQKSGNSKSSPTTSTKGHQNRNSGNGGINKRHDNKTHAHPWLVTTLKGHTDEIRDIGFSSNGKFLASCAEDNIISSSHNTGHRNSATSDMTGSDDINSSSSNEDMATAYQVKEKIKKTSKSGRNRRQRKNHQHQQHYLMDMDDYGKENQQSSPKALRKQVKLAPSPLSANANKSHQTGTTFVNIDNLTKVSRAVTPPLRQHTKLNLTESELVKFLRQYIIDPISLRVYGYPVECEHAGGLTEIYKHQPGSFVNHKTSSSFINKKDGLAKRDSNSSWDDNSSDVIQISGDSGRGSGSSGPPSVDSDASENGEEELVPAATDSNNINLLRHFFCSATDRKCARCKSTFYVTNNGDYLTQTECTYHWGKIVQIFKGGHGLCSHYSCCNGDPSSAGCSKNRLHVWTGLAVGVNGPYGDYVQTRPSRSSNASKRAQVYALDCEMCFTGLGLEVAKVTVVGADGQLVYEHFVRPESEVVDYNTRFSGITEKDLSYKNSNVKTFNEVQRDLLQLFTSETILIGHALENDLRVLRILHKNVIDTSVVFPHSSGFPFRRGLKNLTKAYLKRDIQVCESGHSSFEDSRACLELMLWRVRKDFRAQLEQ